jgi:hypothetical protein
MTQQTKGITQSTSNRSKTMIGGALATAALVASVLGSATAHAEPQGYIQDEFPVGLVYGSFDQVQNVTLLVGGTVEEFCPEDPGSAPMRVFFRNSGAVDLKVNDKDQPIYLYETAGDSMDWINDVCVALDENPDMDVVETYATGTADLKVRVSVISDELVDVFNSVNGELVANDGAEYRVRASADLIVQNGVPVGNPADFVSFNLKKIGR